MTAACGRTAVYVCTAAVERTVHRHLLEQLAFLDQADPLLAQLVRGILVEEAAHLAHAENKLNSNEFFARVLSSLASASTEALIFLSTRGDSLRLRSAMSAH